MKALTATLLLLVAISISNFSIGNEDLSREEMSKLLIDKVERASSKRFGDAALDTAKGADFYRVEIGPESSYFVSSVQSCEYGKIQRTSRSILKHQIFIQENSDSNRIAEITVGVGHCVVSTPDIPIEVEVLNQ